MFNGLDVLKDSMLQRADLGEVEFNLLIPCLKFRQLEKNALLVKAGEVENQVHFIVDGVTRSFFFKDEKEISFEFYFPGSMISSYASFLDRTPSAHSIEAFTPLSVFSVNHHDLMRLYAESRKLELLGRLFTEELFKKTSQRAKDLLSLSATERYVKLLEQSPQYVKNIPLKYLASYLNVTPESLSRIRKSLHD